jgi:predicted CXXCH cytochrome family protein
LAILNRLMKKFTVGVVIILLVISGCSLESGNKVSRFGKNGSLAPKTAPEQPKFQISTLATTVDIHYSAQYCTECHVNIPRKGSNPELRYAGDFKLLCRCHYSNTNNYVHPVDRRPSPDMIDRIPAQFPLWEGQIACITCHDIYIQCHDRPLDRAFLKDQKFLRGLPYESEAGICFRCHNIENYRKYNPHQQLNAQKEIIKDKCLYCHSVVPDTKQTSAKNAGLIGNMKALCIRCHMQAPRQDFHAKHLRKPTVDVLNRMKQLEVQENIVLPLTEDGMITCATCHNPHEKGVIPDVRAGAKGAGEKWRQRLADTNTLCIKCHALRQ